LPSLDSVIKEPNGSRQEKSEERRKEQTIEFLSEKKKIIIAKQIMESSNVVIL
jgi:hypothetical protein